MMRLTEINPTTINGVRLVSAIRNRNLMLAKELLANGADPCIKDKDGWLCMHYIAAYDHEKMYDVIGAYVEDFDIANTSAKTSGRYMNVLDQWHMDRYHNKAPNATPIHVAARFASRNILAQMIKRKQGDVDTKDCYGSTPLHMAAMYLKGVGAKGDLYDVVEILLSGGAAVNKRDHNGHTPLMLLSTMVRPDAPVVSMLLKHGTDANISKDGLSASGIWRMRGLSL